MPKSRHQSAARPKPSANGHAAPPDLAGLRRKQVVEAAAAIIAERGVQGLSLSAVEHRAGMSRGQLTYYFPAKEDILLAVFDHTIELMRQRARECPVVGGAETPADRSWQVFRMVLAKPGEGQFHSLLYTFLAQANHREDFRRRLANLFEGWRGHLAADLAAAPAQPPVPPAASPRAAATLVQALLHGLIVQRAADPTVLGTAGLTDLCQQVVSFLQAAAAGAPAHRRRGRSS